MINLVNNKIMDEQYNQTPAQTTAWLSLPVLAFTPKLLYGMIVDSMSICNSRVKSYLILCGLIQAAATIAIALTEFNKPVYIIGLLTV